MVLVVLAPPRLSKWSFHGAWLSPGKQNQIWPWQISGVIPGSSFATGFVEPPGLSKGFPRAPGCPNASPALPSSLLGCPYRYLASAGLSACFPVASRAVQMVPWSCQAVQMVPWSLPGCPKGYRDTGCRRQCCLSAAGLPSAKQISMATGPFRGKSGGGPPTGRLLQTGCLARAFSPRSLQPPRLSKWLSEASQAANQGGSTFCI